MTDFDPTPSPSLSPTPSHAGHRGPDECCSDYAATTTSRRSFLRGPTATSGATKFGTAFLQTTLASPAEAATNPNVLVALSLRGGADMLSLVVPHGDPGYAAARPTIKVPTASLIKRDAMFGLHPALSPLAGLWETKQLAAVTAVGLAVPNRSHFEAMEEVEDANPGDESRSGWLNRTLGLDATSSPSEGVHIGSGMLPTALYGGQPALAISEVDSVRL